MHDQYLAYKHIAKFNLILTNGQILTMWGVLAFCVVVRHVLSDGPRLCEAPRRSAR
jgi:hypothetical protein